MICTAFERRWVGLRTHHDSVPQIFVAHLHEVQSWHTCSVGFKIK